MRFLWPAARKTAVFLLGTTMLAIGIIMVVAPGPAMLVIPAALAVLAVEFAFAKRWLASLRRRLSAAGVNRRRATLERRL